MDINLKIQPEQKIVLTQEIKQSLKILQMNMLALEEYILQQAEENPLIDVQISEKINWEEYAKNQQKRQEESKYPLEKSENDSYKNPENYIAKKITLHEYLRNEILLLDFSNTFEKNITLEISKQIDKNGYFRDSQEAFCKSHHISLSLFEKLLKKIQSIEPIGMGARNIQELLIIQLLDKGYEKTDTLVSIVKNDLEMVAARKFNKLMKKYVLNQETLASYIDIIRSLEPKPARNFDTDASNYITPDVYVEIIDSKVEVYFNIHSLPRVYISNTYSKHLLYTTDEGVRNYIKDHLNRAHFLVKSIQQRQNTIVDITKKIIQHQILFFTGASKNIRPMSMKDIANITGFHESTISRTVNGKYAMTPKGIFELRYFFTTSIQGEMGKTHSNKSVKKALLSLIEKENKKKPLSDEKLAILLAQEDYIISRRTVAKYREELHIPPSNRRKELR